jgi:hypothetical protein
MKSVEIICTQCGADTLLHREALYEGFTKSGEKLTCVACGHVYATEADVPFKTQFDAPQIFTDADRSAALHLFNLGENEQLCRYCANYIINPFTQFCSVHKKEVQATDTCHQFEPANPKEEA